jgi:nucleoid-associated protein YgaU
MKTRTDIKSGASCYTVQSGDSLASISQKYYGNQSQDNINKIYYSNMATIGPNPSLIYAGQKLYIP